MQKKPEVFVVAVILSSLLSALSLFGQPINADPNLTPAAFSQWEAIEPASPLRNKLNSFDYCEMTFITCFQPPAL